MTGSHEGKEPEEQDASDVPWARTPDAPEPEPDWAADIRERRKARGDRLRQIFDTFDQDEEPER
jgi:hypothetical protein